MGFKVVVHQLILILLYNCQKWCKYCFFDFLAVYQNGGYIVINVISNVKTHHGGTKIVVTLYFF
jgi:hypothetical protein